MASKPACSTEAVSRLPALTALCGIFLPVRLVVHAGEAHVVGENAHRDDGEGEDVCLGLEVTASTVRTYRRQALRRPPSPSSRAFLRLHAPQIWAADFFTVQTLTFRTLFVFVLLGHDRRRIVHWNVTTHPTAP